MLPHTLTCLVLSVYVFGATELGTAGLYRSSDVSMESGSTSGAVSVCRLLVSGVGKACGCFRWDFFFSLCTSLFVVVKGNIPLKIVKKVVGLRKKKEVIFTKSISLTECESREFTASHPRLPTLSSCRGSAMWSSADVKILACFSVVSLRLFFFFTIVVQRRNSLTVPQKQHWRTCVKWSETFMQNRNVELSHDGSSILHFSCLFVFPALLMKYTLFDEFKERRWCFQDQDVRYHLVSLCFCRSSDLL